MNESFVISGVGVVAPGCTGRKEFSGILQHAAPAFSDLTLSDSSEFPVKLAGEIKNLDFHAYLEKTKTRNLDRNAILLLIAAKLALTESGVKINEETTDEIGVCSGTTFSHLWSIHQFDKEVLSEGLAFASPALFPSTVLNAASSHVSIYFNIQGFNATINTGYTSCLEALKYGMNCLENGLVKQVLVGCVDTLAYATFWGFNKLGFMAGLKGEAVCCPFDARRNGPLLGEAAVALVVEKEGDCLARGARPLCRITGVSSHFDAYRIGKIHPRTEGLHKTILDNLGKAGIGIEEIDYISSCANSSKEMDLAEVMTLNSVFGSALKNIPVSSIKSIFGETMAASAGLQIASVIAGMEENFLPPTINFKTADPAIDIDCVPNKIRAKNINNALIDSFGAGGYNSGIILQKIGG